MKKLSLIFIFLMSNFALANIPQSVSSYPLITGATFRNFCEFIFDDETRNVVPSEVKHGSTIFLARNRAEEFFSQYRPNIKNRFILVTHHYVGDCDLPMPGPYERFLEDDQLIAWFTINPDRVHPKLRALPLGIGNAFYTYGNVTNFWNRIPLFYHAQRPKLLYFNCNINTYPDERAYAYMAFSKKPFCTKAWNDRSHEQYLNDIGEHKFVASPRGNGLDCFRTWETLLLGSIPVVRTSTLDSLFKDLPVLIINDWADVTEEFLEQKYAEIKEKMRAFNAAQEYAPIRLNKLYAPYWFNEINNCRR